VYLVAPQLKAREKLGASLDRVSLAQNVPYAQYKAGLGESGSSEREPGGDRVAVSVHASLIGFRNRSYSVSVSLYDAETRVQMFTGEKEPFSATCEDKSPKANEDGVTWRCWIVAPPPGTKYFVRAELFDNGLTRNLHPGPVSSLDLLDFLDSAAITAVAPPHA
jgi:hypothetical protein